MNENKELLELRTKILERFEVDISVIKKMILEMESERYRDYRSSLDYLINCPFEDAIRYRFIMAVETFKRFSRALSMTCFKYDNIPVKEKYDLMNGYFFSEEVAEEINSIINNRNVIAHVWVEEYLFAVDLSPAEKLDVLRKLFTTLKIYVAFVDDRGVSCAKKIKLEK